LAPGPQLPAIFVKNDDKSESLINFNVERDEVVIHRVAKQFIVRRGQLVGCIVNKAFDGGGPDSRAGRCRPRSYARREEKANELHGQVAWAATSAAQWSGRR